MEMKTRRSTGQSGKPRPRMAKPGSQVHAVLACVKFRNDRKRPVRNKELLALWPHIGMSTLSQLTATGRRYGSDGKTHVSAAMLKQVGKKDGFILTEAGLRELRKLGEFTTKMWNENAEFYTVLPWERNLEPGELMVAPQSKERNVIDLFLQSKWIGDGAVPPRFFHELEDAQTRASKTFKDSSGFRGPCGNPECGHKTHEIHRLYQDPKYESAVLCVSILHCRLCGHEVLAGTEDVPVDRVPPLDC